MATTWTWDRDCDGECLLPFGVVSCFDDLKSENCLLPALIGAVGDDGDTELAVDGLELDPSLEGLLGEYCVIMRSSCGGVSGVAPWPRLEWSMQIRALARSIGLGQRVVVEGE